MFLQFIFVYFSFSRYLIDILKSLNALQELEKGYYFPVRVIAYNEKIDFSNNP